MNQPQDRQDARIIQARYWQEQATGASASSRPVLEGYLPSPDLQWPTAESRTFGTLSEETLRATPFLLLVGDSGMGKTHEVQAACKALRAESTAARLLELEALSTLQELEQEVVRSARLGRADEPFYVFVDGVDESTFSIEGLSKRMLLMLDRLPSELRSRLRLRLTCRSVVSVGLSDLVRRFEEFGSYRRLELLPLTREQAQSIVEHVLGAEAAAFWDELNANPALEPLAARPVTLLMLAKLFTRETGLPADLVTIYEHGCRSLARPLSRATPSVDVRLAIAKRVAAASVLCHRSTIDLENDPNPAGTGDLSLGDILGGSEPLPSGATFEVGDEDLRALLTTAPLFSSTNHRIRWAHRSYAEYLAARYLLDHKLPVPAVMSLLRHPDDPERVLIPQLYGLAGWLASMEPAIFNHIVATEPGVLLAMDFDGLSADQRQRLAGALIEGVAVGSVDSWSILLNRTLHRIADDGLDDVLRPWVLERGRNLRARLSAIQLATATATKGLGDALVKVALDPDEKYEARHYAASAVCRVGEEEHTRALRPLLELDPTDDPDDELRGAVLSALWPKGITVEELIEQLRPPQNPRTQRTYGTFLRALHPAVFSPGQITVALRWMRERQTSGHETYDLVWRRLDRRIIARAWDFLVSGGEQVALELSRTVHHRLENFQDSASSLFPESSEPRESRTRRRAMLEAIVADNTRLPGEIKKRFRMVWELVDVTDASWLLNKVMSATSAVQREAWTFLAYYSLPAVLEGALAQQFLQTCEAYEDVREHFAGRLSTNIANHRKFQPRPHNVKQGSVLTPAEQSKREINYVSNAIAESRWELVHDRVQRLWDEVGPEVQRKSAELAVTYLECSRIAPDSRNAGYNAFKLLYASGQLSSLGEATWHRWASLFPEHQWLLKAYAERQAEAAYSTWLKTLLGGTGGDADEAAKGVKSSIAEQERAAANASVVVTEERVDSLAEVLKASKVPLAVVACLLKTLDLRLREVGLRLADTLTGADGSGLQAVASVHLLNVGDAAERAQVWPRVMASKGLARAVAKGLADPLEGYKQAYARWSCQECERWFGRLLELFPPFQDPTNTGFVSNRHEIGRSRSALITELKSRGTQDAVASLERIQRAHPELDGLPFSLAEARRHLREQTWTPLEPAALFRTVRDSNARLVRGPNDLLDLVMEGLGRYQRRLKEPGNRAKRDCWNSGKPMTENELTDSLRLELDDFLEHLTIINREVEISTRSHSADGERLDLHIVSVEPHRATVVIEAKRAWHPKVKSAMERQLDARYLAHEGHDHGVYLVYWFDPTKMQDVPPRLPEDFGDLEATRAFLTQQAAALSQSENKRIEAFVLDCSTPG